MNCSAHSASMDKYPTANERLARIALQDTLLAITLQSVSKVAPRATVKLIRNAHCVTQGGIPHQLEVLVTTVPQDSSLLEAAKNVSLRQICNASQAHSMMDILARNVPAESFLTRSISPATANHAQRDTHKLWLIARRSLPFSPQVSNTLVPRAAESVPLVSPMDGCRWILW